jgi:broad specificity phosphatase PhoE
MTTFHLIRHGDTGVRNMLSGRMSGLHLSETGRRQAAELAELLRGIRIDAIYSSPLERTIETAQAIASVSGLAIRLANEVIEVDFGEWTGKTFDEIEKDSRWQRFIMLRSSAEAPAGESFRQVQNRCVGWMERTRQSSEDKTIVVVSHGDPIKSMVMYYIGLHIDMYDRFEIGNASVTTIVLGSGKPKILTLNNSWYFVST